MWGSSAGGRVTLNGAVVQLHGWNHHTQWPETGCSPTDEQLDFDLALLLRGGANYVRGAHYPQDQRWLDRLDAAGVAMWEEALGPGVETAMLQDEAWMAQQLQQLEEMVQASANHAAIMTCEFSFSVVSCGPHTQQRPLEKRRGLLQRGAVLGRGRVRGLRNVRGQAPRARRHALRHLGLQPREW